MRKKCLDCVHELARKDPRVYFIGSDLGQGTLEEFKTDIPERFFMEGISEQHVVGMAAGLALEGKVVYVNTIATFLTRRCYDQLAVDVCLHGLPVRLIGNGGGMVYAPLGPTHMAVEDIAIMRALPNMTVLAPCDADEMGRLMPQTLDLSGPVYIRLAKGYDRIVSRPSPDAVVGRMISYRTGRDALIVTTGVALQVAVDAAEALAERGVDTAILHAHTVKPLDRETLCDMASGVRVVVTVEEHTVVGGLGSAVTDVLAESGMLRTAALGRIGIPDTFPDRYGSQKELMDRYGISPEGVVEKVINLLG